MSIPQSNNLTRRERRARWAWRRNAYWALLLQSLARSAFSADTLTLHRMYVEVTLENPYEIGVDKCCGMP